MDRYESLRELAQKTYKTTNNIVKLIDAPWHKKILLRMQLFIMRLIVGKRGEQNPKK